MKYFDITKRAGRSLYQAKTRTILTALAIAVGAFTIALAMAAGEGGRQYTERIVRSSGDQAAVKVSPKEQSENSQLKEYGKTDKKNEKLLNDNDVAKIKKIEGVTSVTPSYNVSPMYVQSAQPGAKKLLAPVSPKDDKATMTFSAGNVPDMTIRTGEATIADEYLKQFGFKDAQEAIGKPLTLHFEREVPQDPESETIIPPVKKDFTVKIVAVEKKSDVSFFYSPNIKVSPDDAKQMEAFTKQPGAPTGYGMVTVQVNDPEAATEIKDEIEEAGYTAFSMQDARKEMLQMITIAQMGMAGFGALAILASIFGIINTMYISVLERTQQIGLMKALGMRSRDIGRLFRYEAAWVGLLGGLIGVVGAWLVTLTNSSIASALHLGNGVNLLIIRPLDVILLLLSLVIIAVAAGYFPSRKAAKLDPIEALRTE